MSNETEHEGYPASHCVHDIERLREQNRMLVEALRMAVVAMRHPLDDWKGEVERKALDAANAALWSRA